MTISIGGCGKDIGGRYTIYWSKTVISPDSVECGDEITPSCYIKVAEGQLPRDTTEATVDFIIPEASYGGNYAQFVRFGRDDIYGFPISVVPNLIAPSTSSPHSKVTIKGTGFPDEDPNIKISFDGNDTKMSIATSELGSFSVEFTMPETIAGNHQFKAYDENMSFGDITADLQVKPVISMQPEQPEIGSEVTLTGWGFAARSTVSVKYDNVVVSNSPTTDDTGNFTETFTIPKSSEDTHVITATDRAGNVATTALSAPNTPPNSAPNTALQTPTPITPTGQRFGWFGAQPVIFTWSQVSDTSGTTYVLEVDKSLRFFPLEPGMRKTDLTEPNAIITLQPGTYYWRVKAIDGAGNESAWSLSPYPFQVGLFSGIYLALGAIIFVIIFIFIVRTFIHRVRGYYSSQN